MGRAQLRLMAETIVAATDSWADGSRGQRRLSREPREPSVVEDEQAMRR